MTKGFHYKVTESDIDFSQMEKRILSFWNEDNTFKKSLDKSSGSEFVFYDGPPFANGLPHYGHLLTGFTKDAIARYQTMLGNRVERKFGWDCHGLPAEMEAEKSLGVSGRVAIKDFGVDKFNSECRESVMRFSDKWEEYVTRQGRWVDFKNGYRTMDIQFMESVLWAFKELYKRGLVYRSEKVVPYSWACETTLSNFETRLDNSYRKKTSKAAIILFELKDISLDGKKCYLLAWTTTPWTLPSNMMLAINREIKYKSVERDGKHLIAAEFFWKNDEDSRYIETEKLLNTKYIPLFPYFKTKKNAFCVINADFVVEGEGTGVVSIAPGFGEDDFELGKRHSIDVVCPVDSGGRFTDEVPDFSGRQVFEANDDIIKRIKVSGLLFRIEQYVHNYPYCWRTDTPLIYRAVPSWYVNVTAIKDRMLELNQQINWVPNHVKNGIFGGWLANAKDWAISRNRFWGTPIPVWQSNDPRYPRIDVYGSIDEISRDFNVAVNDLHRPFIDKLTRKNPDDPTGNSSMVRVEDVFDCWFESGSMPFAQMHYPFENKTWFEKHFPSDFITEYISQTRGWFYTLMVLSTALFNRLPFKNCICHGLILDTSGQKLSKRLNNYTDPLHIFNNYGSDSLRFLMLSSSVMHGGDLLLDRDASVVKDILRLVVKPIWSAYHFFTTYANFCDVVASTDYGSLNIMDVYIFSRAFIAIHDIRKSFDQYALDIGCRVIVEFFDALNNWYIRRSRERFIGGDISAFNTLYTVLYLILRTIAPVLPFITEEIWLGLGHSKSIHLEDFPSNEYSRMDFGLVGKMDKVREICNAALSIRNKKNIRVRQPLEELSIATESDFSSFFNIMKDEINVKDITISNSSNFNADFQLKLNFPVIGKRYPEKVKLLSTLLKNGEWRIEGNEIFLGDLHMLKDEYELELCTTKDNVKVLNDNKTIIRLSVDIDHDLRVEGVARDLVRFIQQVRKNAGLKIQNDAVVKICTQDKLYLEAVDTLEAMIKKSTYASEITISDDMSGCMFSEKINNNLKIGIVNLVK